MSQASALPRTKSIAKKSNKGRFSRKALQEGLEVLGSAVGDDFALLDPNRKVESGEPEQVHALAEVREFAKEQLSKIEQFLGWSSAQTGKQREDRGKQEEIGS